VPSVFWR